MRNEKRVDLTVKSSDGKMVVGHARLKKNTEGDVEVEATITNLKMIEELGGTKIKGVVTDYERDDL
jgi:hypothetical protein